jgi:hypothetical protein
MALQSIGIFMVKWPASLKILFVYFFLKIWLSGPVLIVVGAVLCGKVMIDWGPAMERRLSDSLNSQLYDEVY